MAPPAAQRPVVSTFACGHRFGKPEFQLKCHAFEVAGFSLKDQGAYSLSSHDQLHKKD